MLTVIVILLVINILLNLVVGFLIVIALGECGALEKYRFEFEPVILSDEMKYGGDAV